MKTIKEPNFHINGWRFLSIGLLVYFWSVGQSSISSFILILVLLVMASLRWRFRLPIWTVLLDMLVCLLLLPYTDIHAYGLALPIFELAVRGRWIFAIASMLLYLSFPYPVSSTSLVIWVYITAFFFGMFSCSMLKARHMYLAEADEQRKARTELERIKLDLLEANHTAVQHAELMERYRISRQLHDHLGHDLTGALLALQAYEYAQDSEEGKQLLHDVKHRLERSTVSLREAVHNVTPTAHIGIERLEHIIRNFQPLDIGFQKSGDMLLISAHIWALLEACLKEALTNVARHSNATSVKINLQVTESIARLLIHDNGSVATRNHTGSGLRGLKMRARAMGGSLSINQENGFMLVMVIPLEKGGG